MEGRDGEAGGRVGGATGTLWAPEETGVDLEGWGIFWHTESR